MQEHKDLATLLDMSRWRFRNDIQFMDFYIVHKIRGHQFLLNCLRGLPGVYISITDQHGPTLQFSSSWVNSMNSIDGACPPAAKLFQSRSITGTGCAICNFHLVNSFSTYDYGYALKTDTNLELYAYYGEKIKRLTAYEMNEQLESGIWVAPEILPGVSVETQHIWIRENDEFDSFLSRKLKRRDKKSGRRLLVDTEL